MFSFVGGSEGPWKWIASTAIVGECLPHIDRLQILPGDVASKQVEDSNGTDCGWVLRGATSNERYVTRPEKQQLMAVSPPLGRPEANRAVLIPIRKSMAWWTMTQDERRSVFEEQSHHTQIGLEYLPAIARRLHHCRDLSSEEPFDFLTWFEFADKDTAAFDKLLERLRSSEEWKYVDREVELRFEKTG